MLLLQISAIYGSKILYTVPISGKSHWVYGQNFVDALLDRGHEVTCITSNAYAGSKHKNYTEILIDPPFNYTNISK